jgi:integrase
MPTSPAKKITDKTIQALEHKDKDYKLSIGDGLSLLVRANGSKLWQLRYQFNGKPKTLSFGKYPITGLAEARERAFLAKQDIGRGKDPSAARQQAKAVLIESVQTSKDTVELIANEWLNKFNQTWTEKHQQKLMSWFKNDLFPVIGQNEIGEVKAADLLKVVRKIEARGALDTAHRLLQVCSQVWRYAVATGRAERDVTTDLRGAIPPSKSTNLGAITEPKKIGELLRNIDGYEGSQVVRMALRLAPHLFVRPGELRNAPWSEFDFEERLWTIPAARMKARRPHLVPLTNQTMALLKELRKIHAGDFLFPTPGQINRPISDMALLSAIRRMGYTTTEMTAHGFRATASTNLENMGFDPRLIELQLAHKDKNAVRGAYKRNPHLLMMPERKKMMQDWSDYLDELRGS